MSDLQQIWSIANATMQAFTPFYQERTTKVFEKHGLPAAWFPLSVARSIEPEPVTTEQFHTLTPYRTRQRSVDVLEHLVDKGFLLSAGNDVYCLSEKGRIAVEGIYHAAHTGLAAVEPLPPSEMAQLNELLSRIVQATISAPEPGDKMALTVSRWTDPGGAASEAAKTDQYITDLARYRDDAHMAAWKPYGVSGYAWEALTFIWQEQASSAAELAEKLAARGYTVEDYSAALEDLKARGWLETVDSCYQLTAEGQRVRQTAEEETDRTFFIGWSALTNAEVARLEDLLNRAYGNLKQKGLQEIWQLALDVSQAIFAASRSFVNPLLGEDFSLPGAFVYCTLLNSLAPQSVSLQRFCERFPYIHPVQVTERLDAVRVSGLIASEGESQFVLTDRGKAALTSLNDSFYKGLGEIDALLAEDMETLAELLNRLVQASLKAPEPDRKWLLSSSHNSHSAAVYAPLARIDQHLDDLRAFRDDAHIAAWRPYGVDGRTWNTLTYVWREQARSAEDLAETLAPSGYTAEDYAQALAGLVERRWLAQTDGDYQVTDEGRYVRQEAEELTNRYFFTPWTALNDQEQFQLLNLLIQLKLKLQQLVEPRAETTA